MDLPEELSQEISDSGLKYIDVNGYFVESLEPTTIVSERGSHICYFSYHRLARDFNIPIKQLSEELHNRNNRWVFKRYNSTY